MIALADPLAASPLETRTRLALVLNGRDEIGAGVAAGLRAPPPGDARGDLSAVR